jgi:hypothetical protein
MSGGRVCQGLGGSRESTTSEMVWCPMALRLGEEQGPTS